MFETIIYKIFNYIETLTILDIVFCCGIYLILSIFVVNLLTKFKFIDCGEYVNIAIITIITCSMIGLYFVENKYFIEIRNNMFLATLFCSAGVLLLISFVYRIFSDEGEIYNPQYALNFDKLTNNNTNNYQETAPSNTGSYNNYDYYYNKEDKYAEPYTTEANSQQSNTDNEIEQKIAKHLSATQNTTQYNIEQLNANQLTQNPVSESLNVVENQTDNYMTQRLLNDKQLQTDFQKAIIETTKTQEKADLTNEKIEKILAEQRQGVQMIKQTNTGFGDKLEAQLEKMTTILEQKQKEEEAKLNKELKRQQILSDLKQKEAINQFDKELEHINNQYKMNFDNLTEQTFNQFEANEKINNEEAIIANSAEDADLLEDININETNPFSEVEENYNLNANNTPKEVATLQNHKTETINENTFDAPSFEANILDKVKTMLINNNATIDNKFEMVSSDIGNLRDGVQGMVDRMTKVFELLTITLQKNNE